MAADLGSAYLQIVPSMRGFSGTISKQLGSEGDSAGRTVGSKFTGGFKSIVGAGAIAGIAGAATAGLGAAIGGGFAAAKNAVIGFNSTLQQATIGFTTMLGSADKASAFVGDLKNFAAKTPFGFEDLVQNSNSLLGMGIAAKDVIPDLTALGDSVASVGGDSTVLNNTISAFGQTMAKGTLDMGNMNQLLQGGIPNALKILASGFGVTTGEMVKMISSGKVASAKALPMLIKGIEGGTKATAALGGMMDKQSVTFQGAMSNIGDASTQLLASAFKPLFDQATVGANTLAAALSSPQLQAWAPRIASATKAALGALNQFKAAAVSMFQSFAGGAGTGQVAGFFRDMGAALAPLIPALVSAVTAFSPLRIAFTALAPVLPVITLALTQLGSALGQGLATAVAAIAPGIVAVTNGLVAFLVPLLRTPALVQTVAVGFLAWKVATAGFAFAGLVAGLIQTTVQLGLNAVAWVRNAAAQVASKTQTIAIMALYAGEFVANLVRSGVALGVQAVQWIASTAAMVAARAAMVAGAVAQWALNAAMSANPIGIVVVAIAALVAGLIWFFTQTKLGQQIWAGFVAALQTAWAALSAGFQVVVGVFANGWNQIVTGVRTVWNNLVGFLKTWGPAILAVLVPVIGIPLLIAQHWNQIVAIARSVWGAVVAAVTAYINQVRANVTAVVNGIVAFWSGAWNRVVAFLRTAWNSIVTAVRTGVTNAINLVRTLPQRAVQVLSGLGRTLFNSGKALIDGFIGGIRSMIGNVAKVAGDVVGTVAKFFPHSPAKEGPLSGKGYTSYSGKALALDFAGGMSSGVRPVRIAASGLTAAAALSGATAGIAASTAAPAGSSGRAGAGFPGKVTLIDSNGSLLGHMDARIDRYDLSQQLAGAR